MPAGTNPRPVGLALYVATEVRAELARQHLQLKGLVGLNRELMPGLIDYVKYRLGPNPRAPLTLNDLAVIAEYTGVPVQEFIERAAAKMNADALKALEDQAVERLSKNDTPRSSNDTPRSNIHPIDTL